ncbi:ATP-binding protein [Helicobacter cetorum]|uniref:Protein CR006 P-loop domain-containing protein n=1 Tax=Helicobacter cetorum (strain ATCC BAA-429 / MIT 00-7128) TaxID=182217 RepID=I0EPV7_HELC0|nr:AAA family ATPase [Helicobacter cetorum]AFI04976.1 hypothetical protein HCW_08605 [Helicobacter cetorum MIT 00-7128]
MDSKGNKGKQQQISSGIRKITLKNVATFDEKGQSFEDLNFINFIYGANGSGKTTTSSFLKNLADNRFVDSNIEWYSSENLEIEVYNKQFKDEHFRSSHIKGIFTLGKKTNKNLEEIESKKESVKKENEKKIETERSLQKLEQQKKREEENFTESCWNNLYKRFQLSLRETLKGFIGKKETFRNKILSEFENNKSEIVELQELKERIKIAFGKNKTELASLGLDLKDFDSIESDLIWGQKIVGSNDVNIADLINKLGNGDWVAQGRKHISKDNNTCPFCQKETITEDFREQLESYFDTSYQKSIDTIKQMRENYTEITNKVLERLHKIVETEQNNQQTKLDTEGLKRIIETLTSKISNNKQIMFDKNKEMSRSFELVNTKQEIDAIKDLIAKANEQIVKHNEMIQDAKTQQENCKEQTWKFLVNEFESNIQAYNERCNELNDEIKKLDTQISQHKKEIENLENDIKELEKDIVSIKPTVNEINTLLKGYGFTNFCLACTEDEKSYRIQREDGSLVEETLSEGEVTFITFLYYYHLAKGSWNENDVSKNKVLVIDDPISSLDSNILFIVSVLIRGIIDNIGSNSGNVKQVIILTHNTYFYKEIASHHNLKDYKGKHSFWIIKKNDNVSKIENYKENPIKNSYELLWQEVKQAKENGANTSCISLQNTMRRIIEYYFKILGGKSNKGLSECFKNIEEQQVWNSFFSWINDGSHGIPDDLFLQSQDISVETYLKVFEKIFKETNHEAHYNMMMG